MQIHACHSIMGFVVVLGLTVGGTACESGGTRGDREEETAQRVTLAEMSAPARATAEKLVAGGTVEKIDREVERGVVVYDVEATVQGKHVEYTIGVDGSVVGTETSIGLDELPQAVRVAALAHFGGDSGLNAARVEEYGQTTYEIEGMKRGKKVSATFDSMGKMLEEEG